MGGAASILFWCAAVRRPQAWSARCSGALVWARLSAATPTGAGGWGRWGARCAGPAASPTPASRSFLGEGGRPLGSGGAEGRSCGPQVGGGWERGGGGGAAPPPRRALACHPLSPACLPGVYSCRGGCRAVAGVGRGPVGRQWVSAAGGGGGGGGIPPPWFAPPSSPGRPLKGPLRLRRPGRRRSAVGRQRAGRAGACLGRGAPSPRVQRPLRGGCGAAVSSVCLRPLLGLRGRGGGEWGGPLVRWRRPLTAEGGRPGGPGPGGQPSAGGSHSSPAPPYLQSDSRAGPRWGPSSPPLSSRRAGRPGAAVRVSGQRLAGCGTVGSPPRSLSPPSLPREVARAPPSRRIVGGAWVGWPPSPPTFSRPPSGPSPAPPLVWGLGLWRRRVAPAVAPVGEGAAQGPGELVVGIRVRDAEYRSPFHEGRPRRPPVGPRRPDH